MTWNSEFAAVEILAPNIGEVTAATDVEMDPSKVMLLEQWFLKHLESPYGILVNRRNAYSHSHESMDAVSKLQDLGALAIVVHGGLSRVAADIHLLYQDNVEVFEDRDLALDWLKASLGGERKP